MLQIEIDGKQIEVPDGSTVMDAAAKLGIYVPHFCYHKKLSIAANCRMCLVQVEKAAKPMPACATPCTDGMKVMTRSDVAVKAQKGVMEFLLINHPLDCPICDQGGECQLQDLAVGYGDVKSRYEEEKRVVPNKNIGPLISTDMTRCIHCTRCVRFGQEIGGIMEMGQVGRGEFSEIMPFIEKTIDSELSGNMIDLCPVGALTSKPFRYTARSWELSRRKSVSPHDGLGSNLVVQVKNGRVMRVLPADNEAINECWLSDRDRFSYEALNTDERLTRPMIRRNGDLVEVEWEDALQYAAERLNMAKSRYGADQIGALASPHSTLEELYLLQKMLRGLGTGNVDARLRQSDNRADASQGGALTLGMAIDEVVQLDRILLIGSTIRKEQPLLAHRVRDAVKHGAQLNVIHVSDDDLLTRVSNKSIVRPDQLVSELAQLLKALSEQKGAAVPAGAQAAVAAACCSEEGASKMAASLLSGKNAAILLGNVAQHHPRFAEIMSLAQAIADVSGAKVGVMAEAANSVGAAIAGAVPMFGARGEKAKAGASAAAMLAAPRKAYVLFGVEPSVDTADGAQARKAMQEAEFVVALSAFQSEVMEYADVVLPIAAFAETSGTFVNMAGQAQSFNGCVKPQGEARPGWKVLRVLGNLFNLKGFDYESSEQVKQEVLGGKDAAEYAAKRLPEVAVGDLGGNATSLQRIGDVSIYHADALARRAPALQMTHDGQPPQAQVSAATLAQLGLQNGAVVKLQQGGANAVLPLSVSAAVPDGCVRVAAGHPLTATLGALFGEISVAAAH